MKNQLKEDGIFRKLWLPVGFTIPTLNAASVPVKIKIYPNNLKNRDFDKEGPQNFCSERTTIAERQGVSENENSEVNPTTSKTDSSSCLGIRRTAWKEGDKLPKYVEVSGSKSSPSVYGNTNLPAGLILESEFDALLLQQEAADLVYCIALGGSTKLVDSHTDALLKRTRTILFLPDYDEAGATAWVKWKRQYPYIYQILADKGKSAGDAFLEGVNLKGWIKQAIAKIDANAIKAA